MFWNCLVNYLKWEINIKKNRSRNHSSSVKLLRKCIEDTVGLYLKGWFIELREEEIDCSWDSRMESTRRILQDPDG